MFYFSSILGHINIMKIKINDVVYTEEMRIALKGGLYVSFLPKLIKIRLLDK